MEYILSYIPENYYTKDRYRRIALAFCVIFDIVAIGLIFSAVVNPLIWIAVVVLLLVSVIVRILVNLMLVKYTFGVKCGELIINLVRPIASKTLLKVSISDISDIDKTTRENIANYNKDENNVILYDNSCKNDAYVLKLGDKRVILPLDEYLYTLIKSGMNRG